MRNGSVGGNGGFGLWSGQLLLAVTAGLMVRLLLLLVAVSAETQKAAGAAAEALLAPAAASFSSFQEAVTRQALNIPFYSDGVYRQQPLVFLLLQLLTGAGKENDSSCDSQACKIKYFAVLTALDLILSLSLAVLAATARFSTTTPAPVQAQQRLQQQPQHMQETLQQAQHKHEQKPQQQLAVLQELEQQVHVQTEALGGELRQRRGVVKVAENDACGEEPLHQKLCEAVEFERESQKQQQQQHATVIDDSLDDTAVPSPALLAATYLLQPITLSSLYAMSIHNLPLTLMTAATAAAANSLFWWCRFACTLLFGVLIYVGTPQALALALPLALLMQHAKQTQTEEAKRIQQAKLNKLPSLQQELLPALGKGLVLLLLGVFICCCLHVASFFCMGGPYSASAATYFEETVVAVWTVRDVSPNLGLFWYAFSLIFARYKMLLALVFQGHVFLIVAPLSLRLYRQPLALCIVVISISLLFQPSFYVSDSAFIFTLLMLQWNVVRKSCSFVKLMTGCLMSASAFPVMAELWLNRNSGNANFLYGMQLTHQICMCFLIAQWIRRVLMNSPSTKLYSNNSCL